MIEKGSKATTYQLVDDRFSQPFLRPKTLLIIQDIKKKHRPQLDHFDWLHEGYSKTQVCNILLQNCPDQIARVDQQDLSQQEFVETYQKSNLPVVIRKVADSWSSEKWSFRWLFDNLKEVKFKVGQDDDGNKLRIKLKHFFEYLLCNKDDSPLYLFQSNLQGEASKIIQNYQVPKYFQEDLFKLAGEEVRPPYRWFLIGPERSGTCVHIDPLMTSAWNTSLYGIKRWVLFPPHIPKSVVQGRVYYQKGQDREAINYFVHVLPKIIKAQSRQSLGIIEFLQMPGQTVFIPGGWWHAVLNCTDTIAVTQNFMSSVNFEKVWASIIDERPKFSIRLKKRLYEQRRDLYDRIKELEKTRQIKELSKRYFSSSSKSSSSSSSSSYLTYKLQESGQKRSNSTSQLKSVRERSRHKSK